MTARRRLLRGGLLVLALASAGWHAAVMGAQHHTGAARQIRVVATEFSFTPSKLTLEPGTYRFVLVNRGKVFHDFRVAEVPGALAERVRADEHDHVGEAEADPGESGATTVMLEPGIYRYMCHVPGHQGMQGNLVVEES